MTLTLLMAGLGSAAAASGYLFGCIALEGEAILWRQVREDLCNVWYEKRLSACQSSWDKEKSGWSKNGEWAGVEIDFLSWRTVRSVRQNPGVMKVKKRESGAEQ